MSKILVTADLHLREDTPRCRIDEDWIATQQNVLNKIVELSSDVDYVYIIGDIFHTPTVSPKIESMFLKTFLPIKEKVLILAGNHDEPWHSYANIERSSYGVIRHNFVEYGINYGGENNVEICSGKQVTDGYGFVGIHILTWPSKELKIEMAGGYTPEDIFKMLPEYSMIFTGDYHHNHATQKGNRLLINPGCITRQVADMKNYKPVVYIVDTDTLDYDWVNLPDTEDVIVDDYLHKEKERNERLDSFIELISNKKGMTLDFRSNIQKKLSTIPEEVKQEVIEILEEV